MFNKVYIKPNLNGVNGRKFHFDEYEEGRTAKSLKEILSFADAIMID